MISELIATLERLNKLPLTAEERAELMRAVIAESRRDGAIQRKPGPKAEGGPSVASRVLTALQESGEWLRPRDIAGYMDSKSGPVSVALKDLVASGKVERRETGETLPNGRTIYAYRAASE